MTQRWSDSLNLFDHSACPRQPSETREVRASSFLHAATRTARFAKKLQRRRTVATEAQGELERRPIGIDTGELRHTTPDIDVQRFSAEGVERRQDVGGLPADPEQRDQPLNLTPHLIEQHRRSFTEAFSRSSRSGRTGSLGRPD